MVSGCHPRRHSSPVVGFWVQRSGRHDVFARKADVATDALADIFRAAFLDLARQERISDAGPSRADQVEHAAPDLRDHRVGRGEPADPDHRLGRDLLDEGHVGLLVTLASKARRGAVVLGRANVDVPEVGQFGEQLHDLAPFTLAADAAFAQELVDRQADGDGAVATDRILGHLDHLAQQADTVLQAAAVLVDALVDAGRQKVEWQGEPVGGRRCRRGRSRPLWHAGRPCAASAARRGYRSCRAPWPDGDRTLCGRRDGPIGASRLSLFIAETPSCMSWHPTSASWR